MVAYTYTTQLNINCLYCHFPSLLTHKHWKKTPENHLCSFVKCLQKKKKKKLVRKLWSNYRHVVIGYRALWFLLVGTTTDDLISVQSHASYLAFESVYIRPRKDRGQQMLEMRTLWQKPLSHGIKRRQPRGEIEWQWKNFKGKRSRALYFQF